MKAMKSKEKAILKMRNWIKRMMKLILNYLMGLILLIFLISQLFKIQNKYWLFEASVTSNELLSFWGLLLGLLGTMALVILALWQNNKLAKTNDRLVKLEKNRDRPFIKLLSISAKMNLENINNNLLINCSFKNVGKGLSINPFFIAPVIENVATGEVVNCNDEYEIGLIEINEEIELDFSFGNIEISNGSYWRLNLIILSEDINSIETKQEIAITLELIDLNFKLSDVTYMTTDI